MKNIDYKTENEFLRKQNATLQNEIEELRKAIELLREQVLLSRHKRFGASSETTDSNQLTLFDGEVFNEAENENKRRAKKRRPNHICG